MPRVITTPQTHLPVGQRLSRTQPAWWSSILAGISVTLILTGVVGAVVAGSPLTLATVMTVVVAVGAVVTTLSARVAIVRRYRQNLHDRLVEAVAPHLRLPALDRGCADLTAWAGQPARPHRITITYAPAAPDDDPRWAGELLTIVHRRLGQAYEVTAHHRERCVLALALVDRPDVSVSAAERRARDVVDDLFGVEATVRDIAWTGDKALTSFTVKHQIGVKVVTPAARRRMQTTVSTMLPDRWRASWDLEADTVRFEVRPQMPTRVLHTPDLTTRPDRLVFARGEDGQLIEWNLLGAGPHLLVCGRTGSGKTVAIRSVVTAAAAMGVQVWINDPKRVEFAGLRGWPNVRIVATSIEDQVAVIYHLWREMEARYDAVEQRLVRPRDLQPIVFVLDEYRDFTAGLAEWYGTVKVRGMPTKCPVVDKVGALARKGRTSRIHLVLGTQRPDAEWLGGEVRDNFPTRLGLGRMSPDGARMMWESVQGVAVPRGIRGRGTAIADGQDPGEVQVLYTPDPWEAFDVDGTAEDRQCLMALLPRTSAHTQLHAQLPSADELPTAPGDGPGYWNAVTTAPMIDLPIQDQPVPVWAAHPAVADHVRPAISRSPRALLALPVAVRSQDLDGVAATSPVTGRARADRSHLSIVASPSEHAHTAVDHASMLHDSEPSTYDAGDEDDGLDELYQPPETVAAGEVQAGDLILVDPDCDLWAVVEDADADVADDAVVCIDWRGDTDDAGSLAVDTGDRLMVRRPVEAAGIAAHPVPDDEDLDAADRADGKVV